MATNQLPERYCKSPIGFGSITFHEVARLSTVRGWKVPQDDEITRVVVKTLKNNVRMENQSAKRQFFSSLLEEVNN